MLRHLVEETKLRTDFFVSLAYRYPSEAANSIDRNILREEFPKWTREEMNRAFAERFAPNTIPSDFLDFAWTSDQTTHSRETFAKLLLRLVTHDWLTTDAHGTWTIEKEWRSNPVLAAEFSRDLLEAIHKIKFRLENTGTSQNQIWQLDDFLDAASLCHPTVPVEHVLRVIGVSKEDSDEFIDWIDEVLHVEDADGIFENLGFHNPGFSPSTLLYRFRNPLLPQVLQARLPNKPALAQKMMNALSERLRPDSRPIAALYLQLSESAGTEHVPGRYQKLLSYWSSISETESMAEEIVLELNAGRLLPEVLWSIIERSKNSWPPARRLALIEAYGRQPAGVSIDKLSGYLFEKGSVLFDLARFTETLEIAGEILSYVIGEEFSFDLRQTSALLAVAEENLGWPKPVWESKFRIYSMIGLSLRHLGHLSDAQSWLESALMAIESSMPQDESALASSLNNLGSLYKDQGKYGEALPLYQRALALTEKILGSEHINVATYLDNLGVLYQHQRAYGEALPLHQRALAIFEKVLGAEHHEVATCLDNLASAYQTQGAYGEALPLYQRALAIREKDVGPDHPVVATCLDNLGLLYQKQGAYEEALPLHQRALTIFENVLGPEHRDVATCLGNLGLLYQTLGAYEEALPLYQRALTIQEKVLGSGHPQTLETRMNLVSIVVKTYNKGEVI
jgi:tetratricopeptide (TPR) repeat protein